MNEPRLEPVVDRGREPERLIIVLLEDSPADAELERREIRTSGIPAAVHWVTDREGFLEAVEQLGPDVILADYKLPGFAGVEAMKLARERLPHVPFLFVTGTLGEEKAIELMRTGATDCVFKYRLKLLVPALERVRALVIERKVRLLMQRNLEEAVRLVGAIGNTLPVPLFTKDRQRRFVMCNDLFAEWAGLSADHIVGKRAEEVLPEAEAEIIRGMDEQLLASGQNQRFEHTRTLADGRVHNLISYRAPLRGPDGEVTGLVGAAVDVTERKEMLGQLQELSHRQQAVLSTLYDAVFLVDSDDRTIQLANKAASNLFGYAAEELLGKSTEILHLDREHFQDFGRAARPLLESLGVFRSEYPFKRKDGSVFDAEVTVSVVDKELGWRSGMVSVIRDVTEIKRAERERHRYEQEFRALVENAPDIIVRTDAGMRTIYANPALQRLLGASPQELLNRPQTELSGIMGADSLEQWMEAQRRVMESGRETNVEISVRVAEAERWFHARVVPELSRDGSLRGVLSIIRDVTEQKQAADKLRESEQRLLQAQKMEAVGELAGGVAHDFNNMLSAIQGYTELTRSKADQPAKVREFLEEIQKASNRAARLTEQLLLFSRKAPMKLKPLDVNSTVEHLLKMLRRLIGENVAIEVHLAAEVPVVEADEGKIEQVLMNLVLNARDAMPDGGTISIATAEAFVVPEEVASDFEARTGRYLRLEVADTGAGMERDTRERIFEPFFTTKGPREGTGLGLAVVYGIVKEHGGWIRVQSSPGRGSVFQVFLPTAVHSTEEAAPGGAEEQAAGAPKAGQTLLVVEDEEQVRRMVDLGLREHGYRVSSAASVAEALRLAGASSRPFDIVLSDVVLPDGDGLELHERLEDKRPGLFIFTSGYLADPARLQRIKDRGLVFLDKPITVGKIVKTINRARGSI